MGQLTFPFDTGEISDGHHTFNELYDHRCLLFIAMLQQDGSSWWSTKHADGTHYPGWVVAGLDLPDGPITYHLPNKYLYLIDTCVQQLDCAPEWDGHDSNEVLRRIQLYLEKEAEALRLR